MSAPAPELVSVCICTFKRPDLLDRLLASLEAQERSPAFSFEIVVVDNDRERSAEAVVRRFREQSALETLYECEPEQNIALARNRAVRNARGSLVAFIDDDEHAAGDWLVRLHQALIQFSADGVLGPVLPEFAAPPPKWIVRGRFFERPSFPTGTWLPWSETRSGNVLLRRDLLADAAPFREEYGGGGEDVDFFRRMMARGRRFVWCDEALAYETVPPERWRRGYLIRRSLLRGRAPYNQGWPVLKSLVAVPAYALALPVLPLFGHHVFMRYLLKECDHLGRIFAMLGVDVIRETYVTR